MPLKQAYGDSVGWDLWAVTHLDDQARHDAPAQWRSFAPQYQTGHLTVGTIIKAARDNGRAEIADAGDVKNGRLFAETFNGRLLYVHEIDEWLLFNAESGWTCAPPGEADRAAKTVLASLRVEAAERYKTFPGDQRTRNLMAHVEKTSLAPRLRAMIEMAKSEPGMTSSVNDFDSDPLLLGARNGVVDLRDGKLLQISPAILVSKRCNVIFDPAAACSRFQQFLFEIQPDPKLQSFLQRYVGYCLTGLVDEHVFAFLHGEGCNGKSVFIELIAWLLGDYARKIPTDMLMQHQRNPQGPSPDIVSLKGRRFVFATETEEGRRLAEARVKELTGGDTLSGRVPYAKADVIFSPTHKLTISGNHRPEITDSSMGMWRRVILIPFDQVIPTESRDRGLLKKLKAEGAGVLNWALEGLRAQRKDGFNIPDKIKAATNSYRDEQDIIGEFLDECCDVGSSLTVLKSRLYFRYQGWCETNGHRPLAQGRLTRRLNDRGYKLAADKRTVTGVAPKAGALVLPPTA